MQKSFSGPKKDVFVKQNKFWCLCIFKGETKIQLCRKSCNWKLKKWHEHETINGETSKTI